MFMWRAMTVAVRRLDHSLHAAFAATLAPCLLLVAAAAVGGAWDEYTRLGFTTWVSLCRSGAVDSWVAAQLYAQLLPTSILAILVTGLLLIGALATVNRCDDDARHRLVGNLAGHAGCMVAMPLALQLCVLANNAGVLALESAWTMVAIDLVIALALAMVLAQVWRPRPELNRRPTA